MWRYLGSDEKYAVMVERRFVGTNCPMVVGVEVGMGGGSGGGRMRSGV